MNEKAQTGAPAPADPRAGMVLERLTHLHPKSIDLSLGRIERLLARLGHPEGRIPPAIHIAGTNGKGSVLAMLAAAFLAAGLKAHAYTSPHLVRFAERIRIAGANRLVPISEARLADLLEECEQANDGAPITFFEITTAAAFLAFARDPADYTILETGLGGRLDATNVVAAPALCVITPVSIDHQGYLGDTLAEIAGEKAGILKPGIPAVISSQEPAAFEVIERRAIEVGAPLIVWGRDFDAYEQHGRLVFQDDGGLLDLPLPRLLGRHQIVNAGTAIAALRALAPSALGEDAIARGLETAEWPARLERLGPGRLTEFVGAANELWLDGGHNAAAGLVIASAVADLEERVPRTLRLVVGMMEGKDSGNFLAPFAGIADAVFTVPIPGQENAQAPGPLAQTARLAGLEAHACDSLEEALGRAGAGPRGPFRVLITGSLYLAGHVLERHRGYAIRPADTGGAP